MPKPKDNADTGVQEAEIVETKPKEKAQLSEAFQASMLQIFGEQETYKPTKSQVDKMLALQEKGMDYTHKERTMWQPAQISQLIVLVIVLLFVIGILWVILTQAPQYTGQVVTSIIGLIGGTGIGYGIGYKKGRSSNTDE